MPLTINGEHVPDRALHQELLRLSTGLEMDAPEAGSVDPVQLRSLALRDVIDRTLLLQAAAERRIGVTDAEVNAELAHRWDVHRSSVCDPASMEAIRNDLRVDRVSAELTRHVPRPGRAEAERFYRANAKLYRQEEAVAGAHILCGGGTGHDKAAASAAIANAEADLQRGTSFAKVADRWSDCKGVGGSLGWVVRGQMVPEFEDVLFALEPGQRSGIFRTVFGFHIATVTGRRKEGTVPFNDVRLEIAKRLFEQAKQQQLRFVLEQWKQQSEIRYTD